MKLFLTLSVFLIFISNCLAQVTVNGIVTDTSNGAFAVEIVVNDTLSKIMKDPKNGRQKYLKLYDDPRIVVRTDSTGVFSINARETDSLYFKSYLHKKEAHLVRDLIRKEKIRICLKRDPAEPTD